MDRDTIAGRYQLIEAIEAGGMGEIWRGYDAVLDRPVAVKRVRLDAIVSRRAAEELAGRFRREARITARIGHHGVPQVFDAVLDGSCERLFLVMEFVHGTNLRAFVDPDRPLPVAWVAAVGAQLCTVLSHAHAVPVVHRDLKPDNVLVRPDGSIAVLDFGIAAILRPDVTKLTGTGGLLGTFHYMPPEQVQGGRVTPRSDLYALGCLLHELFTGRHVFPGPSDFDLQCQHLAEMPVPLRNLREEVPEVLEGLVGDLLAKAPDHRPPDAYAVYERLLPFLPLPGAEPESVEGTAIPMPDPTLVYRRPNSPRRRDRLPDTLPTVPTCVPPATPAPGDTALVERITESLRDCGILCDEGRFTQAAEIMQRLLDVVAPVRGSEYPQVLDWRRKRAAILFVAGEYRQALPEFERLAGAYSRTLGPTALLTLECSRQVAHCQAELGRTTEALAEFRRLLALATPAHSDASSICLELRHAIALLLLADGEADRARDLLRELRDDLLVVRGPQDDLTQEVVDLLLRLDSGTGHR
ncbi:MAG: eukaryotic-like serine/threonine-protein kinase [Actinomycetota bacterium]|nr:eukaryotic-like serine/threonine-protein kinase [Actinomycetota bacterium]